MVSDNIKQSYTSYDYQPIECIPVIASFDSNGHIVPLYVRIDGLSLKVDSFWIKSSSFHNVVDFNCKLIDGEYLRPISLSYHQSECIWTIPRRKT